MTPGRGQTGRQQRADGPLTSALVLFWQPAPSPRAATRAPWPCAERAHDHDPTAVHRLSTWEATARLESPHWPRNVSLRHGARGSGGSVGCSRLGSGGATRTASLPNAVLNRAPPRRPAHRSSALASGRHRCASRETAHSSERSSAGWAVAAGGRVSSSRRLRISSSGQRWHWSIGSIPIGEVVRGRLSCGARVSSPWRRRCTRSSVSCWVSCILLPGTRIGSAHPVGSDSSARVPR